METLLDLRNLIDEITKLLEDQKDMLKKADRVKQHAKKSRLISLKLEKKLKEFRKLSVKLGLR
jgi:hypothetical protein